MADLRSAFESAGYTDIATIVQSGNVAFSAVKTTSGRLQEALDTALSASFDMPIETVVRSASELGRVIAANPFPEYEDRGANLSVTFCRSKLSAKTIEAISALEFRADLVAAVGSEVYMWCPDGSRSQAGGYNWPKLMGANVATNRNWNTVIKLDRLLAERS